MPEKVTQKRLNEFLVALEQAGGSSGNVSLRQSLNWDEDFYWRVQGRLIENGQIVPGRGKGGSVRLTKAEAESASQTAADLIDSRLNSQSEVIRERRLYEPLKESLKTWINKFGFDQVLVEETHSRGGKNTGGTFTRPDITAAGVRRYMYLPKHLEIVTFEIKPSDAVGIMGVLEAIAHREAAHRSMSFMQHQRQVSILLLRRREY
jgi:hypothetical protein